MNNFFITGAAKGLGNAIVNEALALFIKRRIIYKATNKVTNKVTNKLKRVII